MQETFHQNWMKILSVLPYKCCLHKNIMQYTQNRNTLLELQLPKIWYEINLYRKFMLTAYMCAFLAQKKSSWIQVDSVQANELSEEM